FHLPKKTSIRKQYVAKLVKTFLPDHPLRRLQGAARETFSASGGVTQGDGVGGRIKANFVRAGVRAGAVGAYVDGTGEAGPLHLVHQFEEGTRRCVFLGG